MAPANLALTYCTQDDLDALLSPQGVTARLDDDDSGQIDGLEIAWLNRAIQWATARVNMYCAGRYATADLVNSWIVNNWAVVLACHWLSCRRGNPPPSSMEGLYDETMEDLKAVKSGEVDLPDIGLRTSAWPSWSNVRVDCLYTLRKIRVERVQGMSESPNAGFPRNTDWPGEFIVEP